MSTSPIFVVNLKRAALVIMPLRNISSLAEDELQSQWDDLLAQLRQPEVKHVVFDFEKLNYFGSSMLEAMLFFWKEINEDGGKLAVCSVSETAREILKLSRFETLWPIFDTCDEALDWVNAADENRAD